MARLLPTESLIAGVAGNSVTEDYCVAQKAAFGDNTSFMDKGGLTTMSAALAKSMFGPIRSTFDSTDVEDPGSTPTTTGGSTPTATSTSTSEVYGFAYGVTLTVQASNNLFSNRQGHAFDIYDSTSALLEGNVFESVNSPMASYIGPIYNVPDSSSASACSSTLGRVCEVNSLTGSGDRPNLTNTATLNGYTSKMYIVTLLPASSVMSKVTGNPGVGHI
ncbi:hypothetical protein ACLOAV_002214 [Pseudogymnoascus australis]